MQVMPNLGMKGFITNPEEVAMEILYNYVRGRANQSYMFKTHSYLNDARKNNQNGSALLEAIRENLNSLFSSHFSSVEVSITQNTDNEPIVNISYAYNNESFELKDVNLNKI